MANVGEPRVQNWVCMLVRHPAAFGCRVPRVVNGSVKLSSSSLTDDMTIGGRARCCSCQRV